MAQVLKCCRPVDGYIMYTDTDLKYHSLISTTFNSTLNKPVILTHALKKGKY